MTPLIQLKFLHFDALLAIGITFVKEELSFFIPLFYKFDICNSRSRHFQSLALLSRVFQAGIIGGEQH